MAAKHYRTIQQHFWEYAQITLQLCGLAFSPFFALSLILLFWKHAILLPLAVVGLLLLVWGLTLLRGLRFLMIIRKQTRGGLVFEAGPLKRLDAAYTTSWLSSNWFIHAGYIALHRSQIAHVTYQLPHVDRAYPSGLFELVVTTIDGRRYRCRMSGNSIKAVMKWYHKNATKE